MEPTTSQSACLVTHHESPPLILVALDETKNNAGLDFFLNWRDAIVELGIYIGGAHSHFSISDASPPQACPNLGEFK